VVTILGNLIDNALDAAIEGGHAPKVFVTARTEDGALLLRVEDTGPGLAAGEVAFDRGWSTKADGRGLGLALVRQAVRRGGGTIEVGRGERGAMFSVRLPTALVSS
jgi:sensor histidine kinase regulating citrate/malate metabolism